MYWRVRANMHASSYARRSNLPKASRLFSTCLLDHGLHKSAPLGPSCWREHGTLEFVYSITKLRIDRINNIWRDTPLREALSVAFLGPTADNTDEQRSLYWDQPHW